MLKDAVRLALAGAVALVVLPIAFKAIGLNNNFLTR